MTASKPMWIAAVGVVMISLGAAPPSAFEMGRSTVDGGGAMSSAGSGFELSGTLGQPDAGVLAGGGFQLSGGFWFELAPTDCNEDGAVNLLDVSRFVQCLSDPPGVIPNGCACFDVNGDATIDLRDYAVAQSAYTGS